MADVGACGGRKGSWSQMVKKKKCTMTTDQIRWLKDDFKTLQGLYLFLRTNMLRIEKKRKDLLQDLGIITICSFYVLTFYHAPREGWGV